MLYVRQTDKSVDQAFQDIQECITRHGFGLLHHYDFRKTLHDKGFELDNECRVLEVCNPRQAAEVLNRDMAVNMALPCRVSIYQDGGRTFIGMIPPSQMLGLIADPASLGEVAGQVEASMRAIIDEASASQG